jgi:predicted  nucleic acid-binding Zn ribbon protein
MASFESGSFSKKVPGPGGMREFNVGVDEAEFQPAPQQNQMSVAEMEAAVRQARAEKVSGNTKIGELARQRIALLTNIGRLTRKVEIGGFSFSLRTLKNKEAKEATLATFNEDVKTELQASFESRKHQLVRSIYEIDGQDIALVLGDNSIETRLAFIDELEDSVFSRLFDEYIKLRNEAKAKCSINSEKDVEEVAADLKK